MSMIGNFLLISDDELLKLLAEPSAVHDVIEAADEATSDDMVDVDKAWHCLHFLLTGTAWEGTAPLDFIAAGGTSIGDEDVGYGPARGFTSQELRAIADALEPITESQLISRFDGAKMDELEIYPGVGSWQEVDSTSAESFGYFTGAFEELRKLALRGRSQARGLLVWLS